MEQDNGSIFEFGFDETSKSHLKTIAQWAGINAVVAFISIGVTIVETILIGMKYNSYLAGKNLGTSLITLIISLLMNILLYLASSQFQKALNNVDQSMLSKGLQSFKTYFKVFGILLILLIVIVVLAVVISISYSATRGF